MQLQSDWIDLLRALSADGARYLVIGAAALSYHGHPRGTGNFGVWVDAAPDNAVRVYEALTAFGAPMDQLTVADLEHDDTVWMIGVVPLRVDILTGIDGVRFDEAWTRRTTLKMDDLDIPVISRADLIQNRRASGRPKDLLDLEALESDRLDGSFGDSS